MTAAIISAVVALWIGICIGVALTWYRPFLFGHGTEEHPAWCERCELCVSPVSAEGDDSLCPYCGLVL